MVPGLRGFPAPSFLLPSKTPLRLDPKAQAGNELLWETACLVLVLTPPRMFSGLRRFVQEFETIVTSLTSPEPFLLPVGSCLGYGEDHGHH